MTGYHRASLTEIYAHCAVHSFTMSAIRPTGVIRHSVDVLMQDALDNLQWSRVIDFARDGVSLESLDLAFAKAFAKGHWGTLLELAKLDMRTEKKDFVVLNSIRFSGRWDHVCELLQSGVSSECEKVVIQRAIEHNVWHYIPHLVRHCTDPQNKYFAVKQSFKQCQWTCVLELVRMGLSEELMEFVCEKAIALNQFEITILLLRQGIGEPHLQRIVDYSFEKNCWNCVAELLKDDNMRDIQNIKRALTQASIIYRQRDAFDCIVDLEHITDNNLADIMAVAILSQADDILETLISSPRGKRVFKHVCMAQSWPELVSCGLCEWLRNKNESDLAFHVCVTQDLWDHVVELLKAGTVGKRAQRFAFLRAVRHGAWKHIIEIGEVCDLRGSDCKFAFMEVALRGEWRCVKELYWDFSITNDDLEEFEHLEFVLRLCELSDSGEGLEDRLVFVINNAIESSRLKYIKRFFQLDWIDVCENEYIVSVCVSAIIRTNLLRKRASWDFCLPLIDTCLREYDENYEDTDMIDLVKQVFGNLSVSVCEAILKWCINKEFDILSVFIALIVNEIHSLEGVIEKFKGNIFSTTIKSILIYIVKINSLDAIMMFFDYAPLWILDDDNYDDDDDDDHFYERHSPGTETISTLIERLRQSNSTDWILEFAFWGKEWGIVKEELMRSQDHKECKEIIERFVYMEKWDAVFVLLDACPEDEDFCSNILEEAVRSRQVECVRKVLPKVNPLRAWGCVEDVLFFTYQYSENVDIVRLLIEAGMSTHQCYREEANGNSDTLWFYSSIMDTALEYGHFSLVKLLYASGAVTNRELHYLKTKDSIRERLESQECQTILEYLDRVAGTPRTLQDLCRLKVSHLVGCHPGRLERIQSLPVNIFVAELIQFKDILTLS